MVKWIAWVLFVVLLTAVCYVTWHFLKAVKAEEVAYKAGAKVVQLKDDFDKRRHQRQAEAIGMETQGS